MRLALVIAVAVVASVVFVQPAGADFYWYPRQLPWPTGVQHTISGNSFTCGTHNRLTASSPSAYNADYFGIDFGIGLDQPVSSVAVGLVIFRGNAFDDYGNKVVLDHGTGIYSVYTHLDSFGSGITVGAFIPQGRVLGYAGYTGLVIPPGPAGSHLHFHMQYDLSEFTSYTMNPSAMSGYSDFGSYGYSPPSCSFVSSPSYTSSQLDTDMDDYPDNHEGFHGTKTYDDCSSTPTANDEDPDSWPPDLDDNQVINLGDVLKYNLPFGAVGPDPPYSPRLDLAIDNVIDLGDVLHLNLIYGDSCVP